MVSRRPMFPRNEVVRVAAAGGVASHGEAVRAPPPPSPRRRGSRADLVNSAICVLSLLERRTCRRLRVRSSDEPTPIERAVPEASALATSRGARSASPTRATWAHILDGWVHRQTERLVTGRIVVGCVFALPQLHEALSHLLQDAPSPWPRPRRTTPCSSPSRPWARRRRTPRSSSRGGGGAGGGGGSFGCSPRWGNGRVGGDVRKSDAATQKRRVPGQTSISRGGGGAFASGRRHHAPRDTHLDGREQDIHGRRAVGATTRGALRPRAPAVSTPNLCCPFERHRGFPFGDEPSLVTLTRTRKRRVALFASGARSDSPRAQSARRARARVRTARDIRRRGHERRARRAKRGHARHPGARRRAL